MINVSVLGHVSSAEVAPRKRLQVRCTGLCMMHINFGRRACADHGWLTFVDSLMGLAC